MNRRIVVSVAAAGLCVASMMAGAAPALAKATPKASLAAVHGSITSGAKPQFKYSTSSLPSGSKLYLQRQYGTSRVWKTVATLPHRSGTVAAPKLSMGHYIYRLDVVHGRSAVVHSSSHSIYSFGTLTVLELCERTDDVFYSQCGSSTIQVGSRVFTPAIRADAGGDGPGGTPNVVAQHSSCRSATISYAVSNIDASQGNVTTVGASLTQSKADEQDSSASAGSVGAVTFKISSSAWDLEFWANSGDPYIYYNGTVSCWSSSGVS